MGTSTVAARGRSARFLLPMPFLLAACVWVSPGSKAVNWYGVFPAEGMSRSQAMAELESRLLPLGFTPESASIASEDKIFDRSYNADTSTVLVTLDNRSDPKCFTVTVMIGEKSDDLPRARDVESKYLHALREMHGWRVSEGGCVFVDDNGREIQSFQEVGDTRRKPGPDDKLQ